MDPNVSLQVARLRECFITFLAEIRFQPCMHHNVTLQSARAGKCLITFLAGIRFLSSMDSHMILQMAIFRKCFVTFLAGIWFFSSVHKFVMFQIKSRHTYFSTQITLELRPPLLKGCWTRDFHDTRWLCNWGSYNNHTRINWSLCL